MASTLAERDFLDEGSLRQLPSAAELELADMLDVELRVAPVLRDEASAVVVRIINRSS